MYNKSWKSRPSLNLAQRFCQKFQLNEVRNIFLLLFLPTKLPAYVDGRVITKGGRLILDISHTTDLAKQKEFLVAVNIQKAFDSVNQIF